MNLEEIKFRAKVKWNGNHRFAGDWIYGNLIKIPVYKKYNSQRLVGDIYNHKTIVDKWVWAIQEHCPNNGLKYRYEPIEIDPDTIGQFTGRYSEKGKEIYHGDILDGSTVGIFGKSNGTRYQVKYNRSCFKLVAHYRNGNKSNINGSGDVFDVIKPTIVGNIYEKVD